MSFQLRQGFTLIEIMVALTIIAITMGAIIENSTASNRNAQYLRNKTIASWVGMNQIVLVRAKRQWTNVTTKQGSVEMAGREWPWKMKITKTVEADLRQLQVSVFLEEDDKEPLVTVTGFLGKL